MKIFTKFILIALSVCFYLGAVFLFNGSAEAESEDRGLDTQGQVLGASEEVLAEPISAKTEASVVYYGLPENKDKSLIPEKKAMTDTMFPLQSIGAVMDARSGAVLFEKDAGEVVPIASITKLATALVFLEEKIAWDTVYEIGDRDRVDGGRIYLHRGDKVQVRNLFFMSLVASANSATQAMVYATGLSNEAFVAKMNLKMKDLGLTSTFFEDAVGLSFNNKSTALEVAKLAKAALEYPEIMEATMMKSYEFDTEQGKHKLVFSTDALLETLGENDVKILGGKTGYTDSAGYCFVGKYVDHEGNELLSVILRENNINSRFESSKKLALWAFNNYLWN